MPKRKRQSTGVENAPKRARLEQSAIDDKELCNMEPMFTCCYCIISGGLTKLIRHLSEEHGPVAAKYNNTGIEKCFLCNWCGIGMGSLAHFNAHLCNGQKIIPGNYTRVTTANGSDMIHYANMVGDLVFRRRNLLQVKFSTCMPETYAPP